MQICFTLDATFAKYNQNYLIVAQVIKSESFHGKNKATGFLQLKSLMRICLLLTMGAWLCIFWAMSLDTHCVGGKKTSVLRELPIFEGLDNNVHKEKRLTIANGSLLYLGRKEVFFHYYFKVDIMVI